MPSTRSNGRSDLRSISDRATDVTPEPQGGLWDREIGDGGLEALLDAREDLAAAKREANAAYKVKNDQVKARLSEFSLTVGEVARVGKYRIEIKRTAGGHREFDVAGGETLRISLFE